MLSLGLRLGLTRSGGGPSVTITGLTNGDARPGDHASLGAVVSDESSILTYAWGSTRDGTEYGTSSAPTDYTAGVTGTLYLTVTTASGTYRATAPILYAAIVVTGTIPAVDWEVGVAITSIDLNDYITGDGVTWSNTNGQHAGISRSGSVLSGTPTASGTVDRTYSATNGTNTVFLDLTGNVRVAAPTVTTPVPDQTLDVDDVVLIDLADYFDAKQATYSIQSGTLPAGLNLVGSVVSGTVTTPYSAANITFRATNESGFVDDVSSWTVNALLVAPVITENVALDDTTDIWGVSSDQTGGNIHWARVVDGGAIPAADGAGGWTGTTLATGTIAWTGAAIEIPDGGTGGTAYEFAIYHRTAGGDSNVLSTGYTANIPPAGLTRLSVTEVINTEANQTTYTGTYEAAGAADLLVVIASGCETSSAPTYVTVDLGGQAFTAVVDSFTAEGSSGAAVLYLLDADIPTGSQTLTVECYDATDTLATTRSMNVQVIAYSGAAQTSPVYANTPTFETSLSGIAQTLNIQNTTDEMLSIYTRRANGSTNLPASTDATDLIAKDVALTSGNAHSVLIAADLPGATGNNTITAAFAQSVRTDSFSVGVKQA